MDKHCFIVEDLLPLYNEELLQTETKTWLEDHLHRCPDCQELVQLSKETIEKESIDSEIDEDKMFKQIHLKLSIYQIIFVSISFLFAVGTSLLNDSFGFILSYAVMGLVTYLFYQNFKIVIAIAFLPIFLWALADAFIDGALLSQLHLIITGAVFIGIIHLVFALCGSLVGLLIFKLRERGDET